MKFVFDEKVYDTAKAKKVCEFTAKTAPGQEKKFTVYKKANDEYFLIRQLQEQLVAIDREDIADLVADFAPDDYEKIFKEGKN